MHCRPVQHLSVDLHFKILKIQAVGISSFLTLSPIHPSQALFVFVNASQSDQTHSNAFSTADRSHVRHADNDDDDDIVATQAPCNSIVTTISSMVVTHTHAHLTSTYALFSDTSYRV